MTTPYVGEIRLFGFPRIPSGWFPCDGRLVSIAEYQTLFVLLSTTYGGDGVSTFGLPNLQGTVPVHQGTGLGLTTRALGQASGSESVTLTTSQMPAHTHQLVATGNTATTASPGSGVLPGALTNGDAMYGTDLTGATAGTLAPNAVSSIGNNNPHDNTMPTLPVNICIAWAGIFPTQN